MPRTTKALISADLESISGVVHSTETGPAGYDYERTRALMTVEVNAIVTGVPEGGPEAEVWVADAHGPLRDRLRRSGARRHPGGRATR